MMYPKNVILLVEEIENENKENRTLAITNAVEALRELPDFNDFFELLLRDAVGELIDRARHKAMEAIRKSEAYRRNMPKVVVGNSKVLQEISYQAFCDVRIDGTILSNIYGSRLTDLARSERNSASGYVERAFILEALAKIVPEDKKVGEVVGKQQELKIRKQGERIAQKIKNPRVEKGMSVLAGL